MRDLVEQGQAGSPRVADASEQVPGPTLAAAVHPVREEVVLRKIAAEACVIHLAGLGDADDADVPAIVGRRRHESRSRRTRDGSSQLDLRVDRAGRGTRTGAVEVERRRHLVGADGRIGAQPPVAETGGCQDAGAERDHDDGRHQPAPSRPTTASPFGRSALRRHLRRKGLTRTRDRLGRRRADGGPKLP